MYRIKPCEPWKSQFQHIIQKIHFVTWGHIPEWLNTEHPKLNIVRHEDFIPEKFRPTFNSHTIEWNFHRIPGLAEKFEIGRAHV